jgi:hypothetical protein
MSTAAGNVELAVVKPLGSDGLGVTTAAAVAGQRGTIDAVLPSGDMTSAKLVDTRDGVAIVELADPVDVTFGPTLSKPADDWTVVAFGAEIPVGADDELRSLAVPEAAPIFDADGRLVGLCTMGPNGVEMLPVDTLPDIDPRPVSTNEQPAAVETTEVIETTAAPDTSETVETPGTPADSEATATTDTAAPSSSRPARPPATGSSPVTSSSITSPSESSAAATATIPRSEPADSSEPPTTSLP